MAISVLTAYILADTVLILQMTWTRELLSTNTATWSGNGQILTAMLAAKPGTWGVMGGGYCDLPNPYFLYRNGWLDGENIFGSPELYTMDSTDAHFSYFYYDPSQPTEFYILRPYTRNLLFCPSIPEQGLTVWRVNTAGDNANYPDTNRYVELVHPNESDTQKSSGVCFYNGGMLDEFTSSTSPSSDWHMV